MSQRDRMEIRVCGGFRVVLGCTVAGTALAMLVFCVCGLLPGPAEAAVSTWRMIVVCLGFLLLGGAVASYRAGRIIDRRTRTLTTWWGLLVPFRRRVHALDRCDRVALARGRPIGWRRGPHLVVLAGSGQPITCCESDCDIKARQIAGEIAGLLGLSLDQSATGAASVHHAGTVDETFRARAARAGVRVPRPVKPVGCRVRCETVGDETVLELPPRGFHAALARQFPPLALLVTLIFAGHIIIGWAIPLSQEPPLTRAMVLFALGCFGLVPAFLALEAVVVARARDRITVSHRSLRLERYSSFGTRVWLIRADELAELELAPSRQPPHDSVPDVPTSGIVARSSETACAFGALLSDSEQRWLYDLLRYVILVPPEQRRHLQDLPTPLPAPAAT